MTAFVVIYGVGRAALEQLLDGAERSVIYDESGSLRETLPEGACYAFQVTAAFRPDSTRARERLPVEVAER